MANIITLSEYKTYDDAPSPAENDSQITAVIGLATSYIEEKTGRVFEIADNPSPNDAVETLNGKGCLRMYTRNAPITAVSMLEYWDGTQWIEYDSVTYPSTFKSGSNIIYFSQGHTFYQGFQNIRITFEYGFTTVMPDDLKFACYLVSKHIVMEADRLGITRGTDGEQQFWYNHDMPKEAIEIIARYRTVW